MSPNNHFGICLPDNLSQSTVETPSNMNVWVQKNPRGIWKPMVIKRNNTNLWLCLEPQIFTEASFGPWVLLLPAFLCVCVCASTFKLIHVISEAQITKFGAKNAKHFAWGPYCFGTWLNFTCQVTFNFILNFCVFPSLLHLLNICETCKNGICSTS